jgi:F-type H+-transporting ATPase subunit a
MDINKITPDQVIYFHWNMLHLNATILYTWATILIMVIGAWLITRRMSGDVSMSRWQNLMEILVQGIIKEIDHVSPDDPRRFLPFIGTLFLFILVSNIFSVVPGYLAPTASLSTTAALAACVFVSVPYFGIRKKGLKGYLKQYIQPTVFMLPFNIMGELSRTLALAVRLFGNIMSGMKIVAILMALVPLFFPVVMQALGLLTGVIQAYIFAVLAMVYIASATRAQHEKQAENQNQQIAKGESP